MLLGNQRFQRIGDLAGVQVQHQAVLIAGLAGAARRHRCQPEDLGLYHLPQIEHQSDGGGVELPHPHAGDVGVVRSHLAHQFAQRRVEFNPFDVECQTRRVGDKLGLGVQGRVGFDGDPGVLGRWPHAHRQNGCPTRNLRTAQEQHGGGRLQQVAAFHAGGNKRAPKGVWACSCTKRCSSLCTLRVMSRSTTGSKAAA